MENIPRKIIVHHTASSSRSTTIRMIDDWHKQRQFTKSVRGFFIGYHFVIDASGYVHRTREDNEIGCHTKGQNDKSIGICLIGNFDFEYPTIGQINSLGMVLVGLSKQYEIPISQILPHRYFSSTDCYGKRLADDWAQRVMLEAELSQIKKILLWIQMKIGGKI
jgi:N-acetyl-anhydromuramyl-L-alanine amidase AmpD